MKKFWKENKKILIPISVFVILFPALIFLLVFIGIIQENIGFGIVGYGGSILGGFLTLFGVWWTIEDSRNSRANDLERQYAPFILMDVVNQKKNIHRLCSEITFICDHSYFDNTDLGFTDCLIKIQNVGRGEIQSLRVKLVESRIIHVPEVLSSEAMSLEHSYILFDGIFSCIPVGGSVYWYIAWPKLKEDYREKVGKDHILLEALLEIYVKGVFSEKEYLYNLHFCVDLNPNKIHKAKIYSTTLMLR